MDPKLLSLRKQLVRETKKHVQEDISQSDVHIIRSVNTLTDLDATANLLAENCREWYQSVFPELERLVANQDTILAMIAEIGNTADFTEKKLSGYGLEKDQIEKIVSQAKNTSGVPIDKATMEKIQTLAKQTLALREQRKQLEAFIEKNVLDKAPNFGNLCTPILAGKMIAKAGSIQKLAELPASALQVQGAEKALFAHLKNKKHVLPPKHGFLYNHPLVQKTPVAHRGKMARTISAKLSICLKVDFFGDKSQTVWTKMQMQLEKRLADIVKLKNKPRKNFSHSFQRADSLRPLKEYPTKDFAQPQFSKPPQQAPQFAKPVYSKPVEPKPDFVQKVYPAPASAKTVHHPTTNSAKSTHPAISNTAKPVQQSDSVPEKRVPENPRYPDYVFPDPQYPDLTGSEPDAPGASSPRISRGKPSFRQRSFSKPGNFSKAGRSGGNFSRPQRSEGNFSRPSRPGTGFSKPPYPRRDSDKPPFGKSPYPRRDSPRPPFAKPRYPSSGGSNPQHAKKPFYKKKFKKR